MHEGLRKNKLEQLMGAESQVQRQLVAERSPRSHIMDANQKRDKQFQNLQQIQNKMQKNELRHINNIDDVFKNRNLTFEDIEKLSYQQFNQKGGGLKAKDVFRPSDIIDLDDDSDDEILKKFKEPSKASPKRFSPTNKKYRKIGYNGKDGSSQKALGNNTRNYNG